MEKKLSGEFLPGEKVECALFLYPVPLLKRKINIKFSSNPDIWLNIEI